MKIRSLPSLTVANSLPASESPQAKVDKPWGRICHCSGDDALEKEQCELQKRHNLGTRSSSCWDKECSVLIGTWQKMTATSDVTRMRQREGGVQTAEELSEATTLQVWM